MSLTIKVQPQTVQPVYNEIILVLDSDKNTEDKFQYVVDVNVGSTTASLINNSTIKMSANPDGYGVIDLHKHIEPFVAHNVNWDEDTYQFSRMQDSYKFYDVTLREEYQFHGTVSYFGDLSILGTTYSIIVVNNNPYQTGDEILVEGTGVYDGVQTVSGVINVNAFSIVGMELGGATGSTGSTTFADGRISSFTSSVVMTGDKMAFNGVLPWKKVPTWDYTEYYPTDITPVSDNNRKFLTSILPDEIYEVSLGDRIRFTTYNDTTATDNIMRYLRVVSDNGVFHYLNTYSADIAENRFLSVGVGPWDLLNGATPTVVSGSLPVVDRNTKSYTVALYNETFTYNIGETYNFKMVEDSCIYENYRILFLDKLGSMLCVDFNKVSRERGQVNRTTYKQNYGSYNSTSNTWGYDTWDRGMKTLNNEITESVSITSDWVSETYGRLIGEMIESPEVYLLTEGIKTITWEAPKNEEGYSNDNGYLQVDITSHGYIVGDLINCQFRLPSNQDRIAQVISKNTGSFTLNIPYDHFELYFGQISSVGDDGVHAVLLLTQTSKFIIGDQIYIGGGPYNGLRTVLNISGVSSKNVTIDTAYVGASTGQYVTYYQTDTYSKQIVTVSGEELLPINITTNSYEKKKVVNDTIFNYNVNFEYSYKNNTQR